MRDQRIVDREHLQLLAIFHYVVAGLALLGTAFVFLHYMIMRTVFMNPQFWQKAQQNQPGPPFDPQGFFKIIVFVYLLFGLCFVLAAVANVLSGIFLSKRKNRMFSLVVAGLDCLQVPFGTLLGVFTIVVLVRPSVVELYESNPPS